MVNGTPAWRNEGVAAAPNEAFIAHRAFPRPFDDMENRVCRGAKPPGSDTGGEPLHDEAHWRHGGRLQGHSRTMEALGIIRGRVETARNILTLEPVRRCLGYAVHLWVLLRMFLE